MTTQNEGPPGGTDGPEGKENDSRPFYTNGTAETNKNPNAEAIRTVRRQKTAGIHWYTADEVYAMTPAEVDWYVHGLIAKGAITELDGKVKRAGKTTFALAACKAILDGEPFIGYATKPTKILYVTEQNENTFRRQMELAGIEGEHFRVIFAKDLWIANAAWSDLIDEISERAHEWGADLIVIDTIAKLAGVTRENEGEQWANAMLPLQQAAATGLAILALRHSGKSNNVQVGDSGRGHSSASGDVDIILQLKDPHDQYPKHYRLLEGIGRYGDEIPDEVMISFHEGTYENLGSPNDVAIGTASTFILDTLREYPEGLRLSAPSGSSDPSLVALGEKQDPPVNKNMIRRALKAPEVADQISERELTDQRGKPKVIVLKSMALTRLIGEKAS